MTARFALPVLILMSTLTVAFNAAAAAPAAPSPANPASAKKPKAARPAAASASAAKTFKAEKKTIARVEEDPAYKFSFGTKEFTVGAALLDVKPADAVEGAPAPKGPVIWIQDGEDKKVLDLRGAFAQFTVARAFYDEATKRILLLLDWGVEGPHNEYVVLVSKDAGDSFERLADLKRPPFEFPPSDLATLYMDRLGHGTAIFTIDSSQHASEKTLASVTKKGSELVYIAKTSNGGKSWSYTKEPFAWNSLTEAHEAQP